MSLDKIKIEKTAQNLIGHFDEGATLEIVEDETWRINILTEMSPLLIGRGGQTLQALEHILRLMLAQEAEEFTPVFLDIAGYRAAQEADIALQAKGAAERVLATGEAEELSPMNGYERRLVHMALADIAGIATESVGEEPERKIVIRPKAE